MSNILSEITNNKLDETTNFFGVVEDISDPMTLGRVKVRCFGYHPEDTAAVPTESLPWAIVLTPTTSASVGGVGQSPNGLLPGSWVYGFFMDGRNAQYPVVTHSVPTNHRSDAPGQPSGSSSGYLDSNDYYSGDGENVSRPYHNESYENPGEPVNPENNASHSDGALTANGDVNMLLQPKDASRWKEMGLATYSWKACPDGYACKDGRNSLRFHYGTALAFEKLTKEFGKGKLYLNSAYRTPAYNGRLRGAAKNSMHMQGRALDVSLSSIGGRSEQIRFAKLAVKNGFVGFGVYNSFIHIDTGSGRVWKAAKEGWFVSAIREAGWRPGKKGLEGVDVQQGASVQDTATSAENPTGTAGNLTAADRDNVIRTLYGEARSESDSGIEGVANVIKNRTEDKRWGGSATSVATNPTQFSAWKPSDPNRNKMLNLSTESADYKRLGAIVDRVWSGTSPDPSGGAVFYYAPKGMEGGKKPWWWNEETGGYGTTVIGRHIFGGRKKSDGSQIAGPLPGFKDPTNSYPYTEYRGEPSTHKNARGFNTYGDQRRIISKDGGRVTGLPAAGDIGTFGEPELGSAPQYPFNKVTSSITGHLFEIDDSPGAERVNLEHATGSGLELFSDGRASLKSKGNMFAFSEGDYFSGAYGKYYLTSVNDMGIRSTADLTIQSDGSYTTIIGNDNNMVVSGDFTISSGEEVKIKASKIVFEANDLHIISNGNLTLEAKGELSLKGGDAVKIQSGGDAHIKATTIYADDVMRVGEGGADDANEADTADIGAAPSRKKVEKNRLEKSTNSKKGVTTKEISGQYV